MGQNVDRVLHKIKIELYSQQKSNQIILYQKLSDLVKTFCAGKRPLENLKVQTCRYKYEGTLYQYTIAN